MIPGVIVAHLIATLYLHRGTRATIRNKRLKTSALKKLNASNEQSAHII